VKMKIEEIKTKNQIHKLKLSREGTPVSSPAIEPRHVRQATQKNVSRAMKRWKNIQVEEIDGEQFYFCKVRGLLVATPTNLRDSSLGCH